MSIGALHFGAYKQIIASGNVSPRQGSLLGIFVSTATGAPTITIYDDSGTGSAVKLVDIFIPVASTWYPLPFGVSNGIFVVLGGTVSATVCFA